MVNASTAELRKAAILLTSLPQDDAAQLLAKLEPKQVERVSIEIATLGSITGAEQQAVLKEFSESNPSILLGGTGGGLDVAKKLVERALGKNAANTIDTVRESIEAVPFSFLKKVDAQNLLTFIIDEHPQTIALVLTHLSPARAADILKGLPSDRQLSVIGRIATMGQTNPEIIREVERGLEHRMSSVMSQQFENAGGVSSVAEILNVCDRSTERSLLENLGQDDPQLVDEIRRLMFVFDDIGKFADKEVQTILKNVETSQWAMALKGASDELKQKILGNMSSRAATLLKEEMEYLGPVKLSSVEQAQQQIVDIVRRLEDMGEISINSDEADEQFIQ
ncbi:MAG: flagellar motor switch protein FliG [Pirellulales bacterium]|nr:flagellar motor switch protein FliG [Pirellulales bacterium]